LLGGQGALGIVFDRICKVNRKRSGRVPKRSSSPSITTDTHVKETEGPLSINLNTPRGGCGRMCRYRLSGDRLFPTARRGVLFFLSLRRSLLWRRDLPSQFHMVGLFRSSCIYGCKCNAEFSWRAGGSAGRRYEYFDVIDVSGRGKPARPPAAAVRWRPLYGAIFRATPRRRLSSPTWRDSGE
jgi:hypothetical protein